MSLQAILSKHHLSAHKSLGQNFLADNNIVQKIIRLAGDLSDKNVLEIGPGPGSLTQELLAAHPLSLTAVERDERFLPVLQELSEDHQTPFSVISGDALKQNLPELANAPRTIVANLPYNVATPLLIRWLEDIHQHGAGVYSSLTLMFQKEVAERIVAAPDCRDYGRLSVITQWLCEVQYGFDIPPQAFIPAPKITSTVIRLVPRPSPLAPADKKSLEIILAAAFGQRRKMLRSALKTLGNADIWLERAQIDPTRRAETLSVTEFCTLAREFAQCPN